MQDSVVRNFNFEGCNISFKKEKCVMVSATEMAKPFGKQAKDWLKTQSAKEFIDSLSNVKKILFADLVQVRQGAPEAGGGTWFHEDVALEFARWLAPEFAIWCNDRIKEILKYGMTATDERLEEMITNPDLIIRLATELKKEREERKLLELKNKHQEEVIEGLVYDIPVADMRQRISQIVLKDGSSDIRGKWMMLYDEFDKKYHMKVATRMTNAGYNGTRMDYIDHELNMIAELYDLACKLFESSYEQLMESWGKYSKRAKRYKSQL